MDIIVVALEPEAEPFKRTLHLRRDLAVHSHQFYRSDNWGLIVSGAGPLQSAVATTLALTMADGACTTLTNVGVAGATTHFPMNSLTRIVKITDRNAGLSYYPDASLKDSAVPAHLRTGSQPTLSHEADDQPFLADMEGAGFFCAAQKFLPLEQILLYKVISDHLTSKGISKSSIQASIEAHCETIIQSIGNLNTLLDSSKSEIFSINERERLAHIKKTLTLTEAQSMMLERAATTFQVKASHLLERLEEVAITPPRSKSERKQLFEGVINALSC